MTVYIAARYSEKQRNNDLAIKLRKHRLNVILPREFRMRSDSRERSKSVYKECLRELGRASTLLVVSPFGRDVAFEIGFYQCLRESGLDGLPETMRIVRLNTDGRCSIQDDMISNVVDYEGNDLKEICNYLLRYEKQAIPNSAKRKALKKHFKSDAELRAC